MSRTIEHLARLIAHETVSDQSNLSLIKDVEAHLSGLGFRVTRFTDPDAPKAGLYAEIGPNAPGGILLSAHSDVVPVAGQSWTKPPFSLTEDAGKLFGRGTTDMKGFLAAMLSTADHAEARRLAAPLGLLISYDEEVGCKGLAKMLPTVAPLLGKPRLALVGEPTGMQVAIGHKGKRAYRAQVSGQAGHSALAPRFVNAINVAARFVSALEDLQTDLTAKGPRDAAYDIPSATVHVGTLSGGRALNIVPDSAELSFEFRHLPDDDPDEIEAQISKAARTAAATYGTPDAIEITRTISYPGFNATDDEALDLVKTATGSETCKVAFGTEAGLLAALSIPTLVCGPGDMDGQGHKPDEFITRSELERCDRMLDTLLQEISA
ncbi:MAG: acetylornithine deacetylase [Pseudomonadota bacterium]